jgi:hypothetical protein
MSSKLIHTGIVELDKRVVDFDKTIGIYKNGFDNLYSERVMRVINNSATAKPSAKLFRKYIVGKGLGDTLNSFVFNKDKQLSLWNAILNIGDSYSYHAGCFVHVNYNLEGKIISGDVLPFEDCRIGKADDKKYSGKIIVYDNWDGSKGTIDKKKFHVIDVFNPNKKVVLSQIEKAGDIENYKGQIFYYNPYNLIYPLSPIDNVINDADSEYMSSVFKNRSLRKGFFGKKILITPPMVDDNLRVDDTALPTEALVEKRNQISERDAFNKNLKKFIGADEIDGLFHMELDLDGDDIEKELKFIDVETNINDKLFEYTEKSTANNIRKAYNNIPSILIENSDNSVFGQSGEMLKQAKVFYQEQTEEERNIIAKEILTPILNHFEGFTMPQDGINILPLIDTATSNKTEEAQATLRGSVGGVTALISLQQSVAAGTTDLEAAVQMVIQIYGVDEVNARKLVGTPKLKEDVITN